MSDDNNELLSVFKRLEDQAAIAADKMQWLAELVASLAPSETEDNT